jgi:hypothetical protein
VITGIRLPDGFECTKPELEALGYTSTPRGAYWRDSRGVWCAVTTNGRLGSLEGHTVTEHDDKTITVSPSILVYAVEGAKYSVEERARLVEQFGADQVAAWEHGRPRFHGHLVKGIWTELAE